MASTTPIVVVTDLDGTLLDHDTYQPGPAAAAVAALQDAGVAIVCCSAKTRVEQQIHRSALGIGGPFIVENGAAVLGDDDTPLVVLGLPYDEVRHRLARAAASLGVTVRGFADMSAAELAQRTNLSEDAARRAQAREYTEAFIVVDADPAADGLAEALAGAGLHLQRGARFWTASGAHDKGIAVDRLRQHLTRELGERPLLYGLGDTYNDAAMLAAVDVAFLVQRPDATWADLEVDGLQRLAGIGPAGWCQGADLILAACP
ncbi:MAG TPA: HAD-IIB family hydrolase [Euzebyales bacterium]|nr:HAD-IIB family hydrolase [Euzebyales bacterium]